MINITEMLAKKGTRCRPCYAMKPQYITIHNTANTSKGAGAVSHGKYLQGTVGSAQYVSYHYAVDDEKIVRIIPDSEVAWHAGDGVNGTGNRKSIGIEICENPDSDLLTATDNAAELTAHLMRDYGIPLEKVVQHNYWTGKNCPGRIRKGQPYTWSAFKAKVQAYYTALLMPATEKHSVFTVQTGAFKQRANALLYVETLNGLGFAAFVVYDEASALYRVQAGAFTVKLNAENFAGALKARGLSAIVCEREAD